MKIIVVLVTRNFEIWCHCVTPYRWCTFISSVKSMLNLYVASGLFNPARIVPPGAYVDAISPA
jgi:hypothetical protein